MLFADFRRERGLTLAQTCAELELSEKSVGWLSDIESGKRDASLRLALRIQRWSGGAVTAESVCSELRDHRAGPSADPSSVAPSDSLGAGAKSGALQ